MRHLNQGLRNFAPTLWQKIWEMWEGLMGCKSEGSPACYQGAVGAPSTYLAMPGKALNAPWASPKCKPVFCKSQEVLKRHIFLSGNVWLWQGQGSFFPCCHHFTPQLEGTLLQEWSEMAGTILQQEICTTDQQLMWWKPIFPSKMVFSEWLTRQLKRIEYRKKSIVKLFKILSNPCLLH